MRLAFCSFLLLFTVWNREFHFGIQDVLSSAVDWINWFFLELVFLLYFIFLFCFLRKRRPLGVSFMLSLQCISSIAGPSRPSSLLWANKDLASTYVHTTHTGIVQYTAVYQRRRCNSRVFPDCWPSRIFIWNIYCMVLDVDVFTAVILRLRLSMFFTTSIFSTVSLSDRYSRLRQYVDVKVDSVHQERIVSTTISSSEGSKASSYYTPARAVFLFFNWNSFWTLTCLRHQSLDSLSNFLMCTIVGIPVDMVLFNGTVYRLNNRQQTARTVRIHAAFFVEQTCASHTCVFSPFFFHSSSRFLLDLLFVLILYLIYSTFQFAKEEK